MTQEEEDWRDRRGRACAFAIDVAWQKPLRVASRNFFATVFVEARFVVHGCMMLLYRRRVGDSWQARIQVGLFLQDFDLHGPYRRLCSLTQQKKDARGKTLFLQRQSRSECHRHDGGYAIDNTRACIKSHKQIRMLRAVLTQVGLHGVWE